MSNPSPVDIVSSNGIPFTESITHRFSMDEIQRPLKVYLSNKGVKGIMNPCGKGSRQRK